jgi:hypothetical protein
MTGHESHKAERDKLNEAIKEANEKPSPSALARLVRATFALAKVCPTVRSEFVKYLETPEYLQAIRVSQYMTVLDVLKRSSRIGASSTEVLESVPKALGRLFWAMSFEPEALAA